MQIEEYIVDILRKEMNLDQQHIWIRAQNRKIPPNSQDLYVVVGVVDFLPISSKSYFKQEIGSDELPTPVEHQVLYGRANVQIDIFSRSNEARIRRGEILMALNSFYSKEVQDTKHFKIFELPSTFLNLSGLAGGSDINRFTMRFYAMIAETKDKSSDYYEIFNEELHVEEKSPAEIIELENLQNDPDLQIES